MESRNGWFLLAPALPALLALMGVFDPMDRYAADACERVMPDRPLSDRVRIVVAADEDEAALESWPWDRRVHAQLVECLREAGASCVCFDMLFDGVGRDPEGDSLFVDRVRSGPATVVGAALEMERSRGSARTDRSRLERHTLPAPRESTFPLASVALLPWAELGAAARQIGFLNAPVDVDGRVRRAWVVLEHEGRLLPSLPLAGLLVAERTPLEALYTGDGTTVRVDSHTGQTASVPLDRQGRMRIDGSVEVPERAVRSYSDVFRRFSDGGPSKLSEYSGRIVLVGNVMTGTGDVVTTSRRSREQGLFLQARVLSQLLERRYVRELPSEAGALLAAVLGVVAVLGATARPRWLRLVSGPSLALAVGGATYLARASADYVVPSAAGAASALFGWGTAQVGFLMRNVRRRRDLETRFGSLFPSAVLTRILDATTDPFERSERHEVAMLSARIRGWETAGLAAEEEARLLDDVARIAGASTLGERGALLRCSFDRIFAVFGHPEPLADPVRAAIEAATRLGAELRSINLDWADRLGEPLTLGIGLHVGVATIGFAGTASHREYTAFGSEVSRVDALAVRAGGVRILASERVKSRAPATVDAVLVDRDDQIGPIYELVLPSPSRA